MLSDEELVQKTLNGDTKAYEELFQRYSSGVMGYMRQYINQKNDREDLSQEVFLKAYLQLKTLKKASHFSYWLFRIARNTCLDWRKKPLLPTTPLQETAPLIAPTSPPPPPDLWDYVYQLPEKYQIPVILKHTQKLKCQEIALLLNLPLTTVTKRLSRAYQMLRHPLHSYEELLP